METVVDNKNLKIEKIYRESMYMWSIYGACLGFTCWNIGFAFLRVWSGACSRYRGWWPIHNYRCEAFFVIYGVINFIWVAELIWVLVIFFLIVFHVVFYVILDRLTDSPTRVRVICEIFFCLGMLLCICWSKSFDVDYFKIISNNT